MKVIMTCFFGFRLRSLSPSEVRRSGCYFRLHTTFSGSGINGHALIADRAHNQPSLERQPVELFRKWISAELHGALQLDLCRRPGERSRLLACVLERVITAKVSDG